MIGWTVQGVIWMMGVVSELVPHRGTRGDCTPETVVLVVTAHLRPWAVLIYLRVLKCHLAACR